mmetsp:Transcript_183980/g.583607  ORF Transcript_183980/g.583607 Transcript_183980/m.583607 type:complete len:182 (-) Transcript_183980:26-571(-)
MHRAVDHKKVKRETREDVIHFTFSASGTGKKHERYWTAKEFARLDGATEGDRVVFPFLLDANAKKRTEGRFSMDAIEGTEFKGVGDKAALQAVVEEKAKQLKKKVPEKQVEIFVVHQNIIRYMFMRLMQFDTTAWLNFGGGNCTMTQLRIKRTGDVSCDFFGDHGSMMPVSHYTFNKSPDV